jgi:hypothetical protein
LEVESSQNFEDMKGLSKFYGAVLWWHKTFVLELLLYHREKFEYKFIQ